MTSDNPRSEAPEAIAADVVSGFRGGIAFDVDLDRASAIERAEFPVAVSNPLAV